MDLAQTLVRSVARAFYETRHTIVVDALIVHSTLRDDDLAYVMGMNTKDLHKLCAKLSGDRLISVHTRPELKAGQNRPQQRTYYYIDYRQAIDVIKWRVYKISHDMQATIVPASERKEYFCDVCKAEWTQMEVLDSVSNDGFVCHRCKNLLKHDLERNSVGHQKSTRMNNQFRFITDILPRIDSIIVPENTFELAFSKARPVHRKETHQAVASTAVDVQARPTAVKGMAMSGPKSIAVSVSTADNLTEEERKAERERKERIAKQNAVPEWISKSTVTGDSYTKEEPKPSIAITKPEADSTSKLTAQIKETEAHSQIGDLFSRIKAEQEAEAARKAAAAQEEDSGSEDEEDDDEGFEDVIGTHSTTTNTSTNSTATNSPGRATPLGVAAANSSAPFVPSPLRQADAPPTSRSQSHSASDSQTSLKRSRDGSAPGFKLPLVTMGDSDDDRRVKKSKVEDAPAAAVPVPPANVDDDDDEEEIEFEDV